jgi:hypothetical protein
MPNQSPILSVPADFPHWQRDPGMKLLYPPSTAEVEDAWCHTSNPHVLSYGGVQ